MDFFISNKNSIKLKGPLGRSKMWEQFLIESLMFHLKKKNLFEVSSDELKNSSPLAISKYKCQFDHTF